MIDSTQEMFAKTKKIRESETKTRFPDTREEVERESDDIRKGVAKMIHQESHVKKTWTHGH